MNYYLQASLRGKITLIEGVSSGEENVHLFIFTDDNTLIKELEEKLHKQQKDAARRENTLVHRLTTKEQELQDYLVSKHHHFHSSTYNDLTRYIKLNSNTVYYLRAAAADLCVTIIN